MITLPNSCYCSDLKVHPKNWNQSAKAMQVKTWYIFYRFYDPSRKADYPKGYQKMIKGMNKFKTLEERRASVKDLLETELELLQVYKFNPITGGMNIPEEEIYIIHPETGFIQAIREALKRIKVVEDFRKVIKSTVKHVEQAAIKLRIDKIPVSKITRKHIRAILDYCSRHNKIWTAYTFNSYRKNLGILFKELIEIEAMEHNPVTLIAKQKQTSKVRRMLTPDERKKINDTFMLHDPAFWRLINIFFHSGSRTTELCRVQGEHVDLDNQTVSYLVLKGKTHHWVNRPIKDIALPFWRSVMKACKPKDYVFSEGLKPGATPISAKQISRRWNLHVVKHLKINVSFYSLKHLNTDEMAALLGINDAARLNAHTSSKTTLIYAVNEVERQQERIKRAGNAFTD